MLAASTVTGWRFKLETHIEEGEKYLCARRYGREGGGYYIYREQREGGRTLQAWLKPKDMIIK